MVFDPPPKPRSLLDRHRILGPNAGVKVSPLCLGAMNFGDAWTGMLGECTKETSFSILDYFYLQGGNFLDTSNNYQDEQSEIWIGEWLAKYPGRRDEFVIATKFTTNYRAWKRADEPDRNYSVFGGNNTKSLHVSVHDSLKKLGTNYIDILYVHWWDYATSIPELMLSLNALLNQGRVIYLGASDIPAFIVAQCNQYARDHGLRGFVVYQGLWSVANRDFDRDILYLARHEGLALAPWGALGGGRFKSKELRDAANKGEKTEGRAVRGANDPVIEKITTVLEEIANDKGTIMTSVALSYVLHKAPYVFPIVGGRNVDHLKGNIEALGLELTEEDMEKIETAIDFDPGFPATMLGRGRNGAQGPKDVWLAEMGGNVDHVDFVKPIKPQKLD
jgi:aryl-alcohol dehydrogenase-like predicted oxidoreductase